MKNKLSRLISLISLFGIFFLLGTVLSVGAASAYIDPSAMTFIIQVIAAAAITIGGTAVYYFNRLKRKFSRKKDSADEVEELDRSEDGFDDSEFDIYG